MESKLIYIYFIKSIKIETASAYDFKKNNLISIKKLLRNYLNVIYSI